MEELIKELKQIFPNEAEFSSRNPNRLELDVTTNISPKAWHERMKDFENTDKVIPNSWIKNGIRIVLFYGKIKFYAKINEA